MSAKGECRRWRRDDCDCQVWTIRSRVRTLKFLENGAWKDECQVWTIRSRVRALKDLGGRSLEGYEGKKKHI